MLTTIEHKAADIDTKLNHMSSQVDELGLQRHEEDTDSDVDTDSEETKEAAEERHHDTLTQIQQTLDRVILLSRRTNSQLHLRARK